MNVVERAERPEHVARLKVTGAFQFGEELINVDAGAATQIEALELVTGRGL